MNFNWPTIVEKALHQFRQPAEFVLHDDELAQKCVAILRRLGRITGAQLIEREADEVQRILNLVRETASQLAERGETFESIQFLLALSGAAKLADHVVEAPR